MSDTLPRVTVTNEWKELYAETGITKTTALSLQVTGGYSALIVFSEDKPAEDIIGFTLYPLVVRDVTNGNLGVWVKTSPNSKDTTMQVGEAGKLVDSGIGNGSKSVADGIYVQLDNVPSIPGVDIFAEIRNLNNRPLAINQILTYSVCPSIESSGNSRVGLSIYYNPNTTGSTQVFSETSAFSNSNNGETFNIKGWLVDINAIDTFDTTKNSTELKLDSGCISYDDTNGVFVEHDGSKEFIKQIVIGANKSIVAKLTNSAIGTGLSASISFSFAGEYLTNSSGLPAIPLTVDGSIVSVDNTNITTDQTEI